MRKMFYEERTGKYYPTLKAAKEAAKKAKESPYISRVWIGSGNNEIIGNCLIFAYGEMVSTIKSADTCIYRKLKNKDYEKRRY